jgi:hypothetical protein
MCYAMYLFFNRRNQVIQGSPVALVPVYQEICDL